ncbi:unnamed protein product [Aureobasidium pullulans]|nr:unnamed protein product [Aureobasidium pullulans]
MRPAQLLSSIALFSALSSASAPWSESFHLKAIREINDFVFPRQDNSGTLILHIVMYIGHRLT